MCGKCLWAVAVISLAAGGALLGGDAGDAGAKALAKIQGTWRFVSQEMAGQPRPPEEVKKLTITFKGDKWTVREAGKVVQAGTHKLDPTTKPGHVDAVVTEGQDKGSTMLGIYQLKEDTMKVCFDPQGKERPTSFKPKEGQFAAVIQREHKK
jgi:uncharacterized protein (TIGR03067 family)